MKKLNRKIRNIFSWFFRGVEWADFLASFWMQFDRAEWIVESVEQRDFEETWKSGHPAATGTPSKICSKNRGKFCFVFSSVLEGLQRSIITFRHSIASKGSFLSTFCFGSRIDSSQWSPLFPDPVLGDQGGQKSGSWFSSLDGRTTSKNRPGIWVHPQHAPCLTESWIFYSRFVFSRRVSKNVDFSEFFLWLIFSQFHFQNSSE